MEYAFGDDRKAWGDTLGWISLACNLPLIVMTLCNRDGCGVSDNLFGLCVIFLGAGVVLAIAAASVGRTRWLPAVLAPVVTFVAALLYTFTSPNFRLICW